MPYLPEFVAVFPQRLAAIVIVVIAAPAAQAADESPLEIFNQRIMPIFRSENPSSCVQCHLSSVDLKNYILPSSEATFASLRDQGLIDLEAPQESKILHLIRMGEKDLDEGAKLIHNDVRGAELAAFSAWITACCENPAMRNLPAAKNIAAPEAPDEVIRHARKSRVVDSFVRHVWSQRMRCFPCHTPHEIDPDNPQHAAAIKNLANLAERFGADIIDRIGFFRETPEATLDYLIESSRSTPDDCLPMINLAEPTMSLLIQKPLSKLPPRKADKTFEPPSNRTPVSHLGGLKMHPHDQTYKGFVAWIQDYARVVNGDYRSAEELPADNWRPTQLVLRITAAPDQWKVGDVVQLFVHRWNDEQDAWNDEPIAFTQGTVTPRHMVNGALLLLGGQSDSLPSDPQRESTLPAGRYLVKTYLDSQHKVARNPAAMLSRQDYYGKIEIPAAQWNAGFKLAEVVSGKAIE